MKGVLIVACPSVQTQEGARLTVAHPVTTARWHASGAHLVSAGTAGADFLGFALAALLVRADGQGKRVCARKYPRAPDSNDGGVLVVPLLGSRWRQTRNTQTDNSADQTCGAARENEPSPPPKFPAAILEWPVNET